MRTFTTLLLALMATKALAFRVTVQNNNPHETIAYSISTVDHTLLSGPYFLTPLQKSVGKPSAATDAILIISMHPVVESSTLPSTDLIVKVANKKGCSIIFSADNTVTTQHCNIDGATQ